MASNIAFVVILAVIGCCFAQEMAGKCQPSPQHLQYGLECLKEIRGDNDLDYSAFETLNEEEQMEIGFRLMVKEGILSPNHETVYKQRMFDSIEDSPNTEKTKQAMKDIVTECMPGEENEYPAEESFSCLTPLMASYCKN